MKLYRFSQFLVFCTAILLMAGGLVTSHEAGLSVPDWPLSYGQLMPPMIGNIAWEHGHRMIAGTVGILTLILAILTQVAEKRKWLKRLAWMALFAVGLQALLGGLTVLYMLPDPISIFHACLAQTFFCLLIAISYYMSPVYKSFVASQHNRPSEATRLIMKKTKRLTLWTTLMIYAQLILGAMARHSEFTVVPHIILAIGVVGHVALLMRHIFLYYTNRVSLTRAATLLSILTVAQFFLGMGAFIYTRMLERGYSPSTGEVLFTAIHQSNGAFILGASFFITLVIWSQSKVVKVEK